jgi:hypothetical protein
MTLSLRPAAIAATLCATLLVLTSCSALPVGARLRPKKFHAEIGGEGPAASMYSVTLENGSLYYETSIPAGATRKNFSTKIQSAASGLTPRRPMAGHNCAAVENPSTTPGPISPRIGMKIQLPTAQIRFIQDDPKFARNLQMFAKAMSYKNISD